MTANGLDDTADLERLLARLMIKIFPGLAFLNVRTYRVVKVYTGVDYGRCDLALDADPEQQIPRVDQWPGIPGGVGLPAVGSLCEVTWRDGDQKSPVIVGFQASRTAGGKPTEVKIDASTLIRLGGSSSTALAHAAPISTWAALVVTALGGLGASVPALANPATVKVKGE